MLPAATPTHDPAAAFGARLLATLPVLRLQSLSLLDRAGDVLWRNEGVPGPAEQACAAAALATLAATHTKAHTQDRLEDGRGALFLAVRTAHGALAGVVMLLMDARTLGSGNLAARILTTAMRELLQETAAALAAGRPPAPLPEAGAEQVLAILESAPPAYPAPALIPTLQPSDILPTATDPAAGTLDTTAMTETGAMLLQAFERLRPGGDSRRFKVSARDEQQRGNTAATLEQLLAWLRAHPRVLRNEPPAFTIAVSSTALKDERLPARLAALLQDPPLPLSCICFELREQACIGQRPLAERLLAWCEGVGATAVIDDFTFNTAALDLLRSSAVKLLKVEARLCGAALTDRLAQARVVAIVQAARILGLHCVAKYVDSSAGRSWLAAAGFDFLQSMTTEPLQSLARGRGG